MSNSIVFGGTSGIGKELSKKLLLDGYKVVITGRSIDLLYELKAQYPDKVKVRQNDIQDIKQTEAIFNEIADELGTVDIIIHCSGIGYENPNLEWNKEYDTLKTNVVGATKIYDLAFLLFKKQGFGHLVGISSIASLRGNRESPAYFASKAFQVNYLESLYFKAREIKGGKVHITDVRPGFVDTKMALGDGIFWMSSLDKASNQIYSAIRRKKRRVYISKRWNLIAWVLKIVPSWLMKKVM